MAIILILAAVVTNWVMLMLIPILYVGVSILLIKQLSDDPEKPNKPYFFTAIEPGRIKAVLRGGKVRKYLMNYPGHRFIWDRNPDPLLLEKDESWDVTDDQPGDRPLIEEYAKFNRRLYLLWFVPSNFMQVFSWSNGVIFSATGHKFVGLWPFQVLRIYRFNRKIQKLDEQGRPLTNEQGLPVLVDSLEMTDHVRARSFVRQSSGQEVETKEGLRVKVTWVADVRTTNPQKALFGTDRWDVVLDSTIIRSLASKTRTMPIDQVLTVSETTKRDALAKSVLGEVNKKLLAFGLALDTFNIVDFEANLSEEDQKALTAKWRAERNREATKIDGVGRGEGRAAEITLVANAIREGGNEAERAQELEAQIATAKAVGEGGGVAIIGGQSVGDGTQAAILAELRKLNEGKK